MRIFIVNLIYLFENIEKEENSMIMFAIFHTQRKAM